MSGGIAYVLDEAGDFATRCNMELVGAGKLTDADEIEEVWKLIQRHQTLHAQRDAPRKILADWKNFVPKFVKVMPQDYKRVLKSLKKVQAQAAKRRRSGHGRVRRKREGRTLTNLQSETRTQDGKTNRIFRVPTRIARPTVRRSSASPTGRNFTSTMPEADLKKQGARCMDCGIPFCHTGQLVSGMASGCPIHNLIPGVERSGLSRPVEAKRLNACTRRIISRSSPAASVLRRAKVRACCGMNDPPVTIKNIEVQHH
jgi:site-specific DNA-cytosine methylase